MSKNKGAIKEDQQQPGAKSELLRSPLGVRMMDLIRRKSGRKWETGHTWAVTTLQLALLINQINLVPEPAEASIKITRLMGCVMYRVAIHSFQSTYPNYVGLCSVEGEGGWRFPVNRDGRGLQSEGGTGRSVRSGG